MPLRSAILFAVFFVMGAVDVARVYSSALDRPSKEPNRLLLFGVFAPKATFTAGEWKRRNRGLLLIFVGFVLAAIAWE